MENQVRQMTGSYESKPPEINRLRTKLSTVRNCLSGITNLIQNVPREAIDVTAMSDMTVSDENGKFFDTQNIPGLRKQLEFQRPLPVSNRFSSEQIGSNLQNRRSLLPSLPSSIEVEIITNDTASFLRSSSVQPSSTTRSSSSSINTDVSTSIGPASITKSNFSSSTPSSSIGRQALPTPVPKTGTTFMQIKRGREGGVVVCGDFPRSQNLPTVDVGRYPPVHHPAPKNMPLVQTNANAVDQQSKDALPYPRNGQFGQRQSTMGSAAFEYSFYPSIDLDEDVLNENLRRFMSDDDSDSDDAGSFQRESLSAIRSQNDSGQSRVPLSVLADRNEPSQGKSNSDFFQPPLRKPGEFHPAANSTLIGGFDNVESTFGISMSNNINNSTPILHANSGLEVEDGPAEDQRNVGTQISGQPLGNGKGHNHADKLRCAFCRRHFDSFEERKSHVESNHTKKGYKCNICQINFMNKHNLRKHRFIKHNNCGEPMVCNTCRQEFQDYRSYQEHVRTHRKARHREEVTCPNCDFKFQPQPDRSANVPETPVIQPLSCDPCKFKTNYPSSFLRHSKSSRHLRRLEFMRARSCKGKPAQDSVSTAQRKEGESTGKEREMPLSETQEENTSTEVSQSIDVSTLDETNVLETGEETMDSMEQNDDSHMTELGISILNFTKVEAILEQEEMVGQSQGSDTEANVEEDFDDESEVEMELSKSDMENIMADLDSDVETPAASNSNAEQAQ